MFEWHIVDGIFIVNEVKHQLRLLNIILLSDFIGTTEIVS